MGRIWKGENKGRHLNASLIASYQLTLSGTIHVHIYTVTGNFISIIMTHLSAAMSVLEIYKNLVL